ncbi:Spore wall protein 12 [Dictyocoela roeselum]|nr:Spore wall protein 12 [Dictyocoela roeselum]
MDKLKGVMRNIDRIDYTRTAFPSDYEAVEQDYRCLRDRATAVKNACYVLMTYESGGHAYKTAMQKLEVVGERLNSTFFKNDSVYKRMGEALADIAKVRGNGELGRVADKLGSAFHALEHAKLDFNSEIQTQIMKLHDMEAKAKEIDKRRVEAKNLRYDLEKMYKKKGDDDPALCELKTRFETHTRGVLDSMREFNGSEEVLSALRSIADVHAKFGDKNSNLFREVK